MKILKSYNVQIWVGLGQHYNPDTIVHPEVVRSLCQTWTDDVKDCVTVTPTEFIYAGGNEPGVVVGLIQYPRFEMQESDILDRAIALATILMHSLDQFRVTITTPTESFMLENTELILKHDKK